jgi:alpha-tubulin suppressor-like RCC1 family protein
MWHRYKIVGAGSGRSHTVVVTEDGHSLAFGWNKHGQLGSGSVKNGSFFSVKLV